MPQRKEAQADDVLPPYNASQSASNAPFVELPLYRFRPGQGSTNFAMLNSEEARECILQLQKLQSESIDLLSKLFGTPSVEKNASETEPSPEKEQSFPDIEPRHPFPKGWDLVWDSQALVSRKRTILAKIALALSVNLKELEERNLNTNDNSRITAMRFIHETVSRLQDFSEFTFDRDVDDNGNLAPSYKGFNLAEWDDEEAFHIRDFDKTGVLGVSRSRDDAEKVLLSDSAPFVRHLLRPRPERDVRGREIDIQTITPSALAAIFMSEGLNAWEPAHHELADALALQRHLSTDSQDRFFQHETYVFNGRPGTNDCWSRTWWTLTVTFYAIHKSSPGKDSAPLAQAGIFNSTFPEKSLADKFIREEKFTVSFSSHRTWDQTGDTIVWGPPRFKTVSDHGPWQLVSIGAPRPRYLTRERLGPFEFLGWIIENLEQIQGYWLEVLGELDRQISVPTSVMFNPDVRSKILFEDEDFSNSKRYFWALQSLRVFAETVEQTIAIIPKAFRYSHVLGDYSYSETEKQARVADIISKYESLRDRIERKRTEIQGLSDGLFSASSVVEARLAANQNNNIRLLTLVTIAFLPFSLVTAIFSMQVLPPSATLAAFFVTSLLVALITFMVVFNLHVADRLLSKTYGEWTRRMRESMTNDTANLWRERGSRLNQSLQFSRDEKPVSNWWYVGFAIRRSWNMIVQSFGRKLGSKANTDALPTTH